MSEETQVVPEVTTEAPATEPNVAPAETAEGTPPADQQVEAKTFTQEELDSIVQKRLDKERRKFERKQIEMETRERIAQERAAKPPADDPEPQESQFETYGEYLKALAKHEARQTLRAERLEAEQAKSRASQQTEAQRINERQQELIEKGETKFEDFEEVIKSDTNEYSRAAYLAALESDISSEILYHLAKNPEEGKRIASLPAYAQAKEIGKLEDKLSAKKPVKTSNAPEPIKPLGNGTSAPVDLAKASMDDYMKHRLKDKPVWAR
jgi:hypothetical protein